MNSQRPSKFFAQGAVSAKLRYQHELSGGLLCWLPFLIFNNLGPALLCKAPEPTILPSAETRWVEALTVIRPS